MASTGIPDIRDLGDGPQNMLSVAVALLVVTWVALSLRILARGFLLRSFGWDDWTMILTVVRSGIVFSQHVCSHVWQIAFSVQCGYLIRLATVEMAPGNDGNLQAILRLVTVSTDKPAC